MTHLDDGLLRRMIDEPLATSDTQRRHIAGCAHCRQRQESIAGTAHQVQAALALPSTALAPSIALARFHRQRATQDPRSTVNHRKLRSPRVLWPGRFIGALGAVAILVGVGSLTPARSLAQQFVTLFQPQSVQTVQTTAGELRSLQGLRRYGTVHGGKFAPSVAESSAAAASTASGMTVLVPGTGVAGMPTSTPNYAYEPLATASFTFNAHKAQVAAARRGETIPAMPPKINGSTLNLSLGPVVLTTYGASATHVTDIPQLAIGQMRAPTVTSSGVGVRELENYILSLPEVPTALAKQIRRINDPTSTLPIPIPVNLVSAHSVSVAGVQGVAVGDNTGLGSGVLWEKDGIVYAVVGPLTESQVLGIADSLH